MRTLEKVKKRNKKLNSDLEIATEKLNNIRKKQNNCK